MRYGTVELDAAFIDLEDIVAKLHFLERMEARWPYAPAKGAPLTERVSASLGLIPVDLQRFALAAFANVLYLPDALLRESWSYIAATTARHLGLTVHRLFEQAHLLEVDPSGLIPSLLHENRIHGRLDTDRFSRLQSVEGLANHLQLFALRDTVDVQAASAIRLAFSKPYWLVVSDNVLSGTSVMSDLARCQRLINAYAPLGTPKIVPVAQVLTSVSEATLREEWETVYALRVDERARVVPENEQCTLFNSQETLAGVLRLSEWLADQEWFASDPRLHATIQKSGDRMAFGFKRGGWTIVTPNCPTNSLPILWYECDNAYSGPFPRVMSRTTQARGAGEELTSAAVALAPKVLTMLGTAG